MILWGTLNPDLDPLKWVFEIYFSGLSLSTTLSAVATDPGAVRRFNRRQLAVEVDRKIFGSCGCVDTVTITTVLFISCRIGVLWDELQA